MDIAVVTERQIANGVAQFLAKQAEDAVEFKNVRLLLQDHLLRPHKIVIGFSHGTWFAQRAGRHIISDPSYAVVLSKTLELIKSPTDDAERS